MKRAFETILKDDVQQVFDHFCACFDIRILFYSSSGKELKVGLNKPDSGYCRLIQSDLLSEQHCLDLDERKRQEALRRGETVCYVCHAGLTEAIKPVFYENQLLGFAAIGQVRSNEVMPESIDKLWQTKRHDDELREAYLALPHVPQDKISDILGLFSILVDYVVSHKMVVLKGRSVFEEAVSFINSNIQADISISEAAAHVGKSISTVSHTFKKKTGKSFKCFVIEAKLALAEEIMATEPGTTIAKAASRVGFSDPLYFSRIYKKHRGIAPSEFLKKHKG